MTQSPNTVLYCSVDQNRSEAFSVRRIIEYSVQLNILSIIMAILNKNTEIQPRMISLVRKASFDVLDFCTV